MGMSGPSVATPRERIAEAMTQRQAAGPRPMLATPMPQMSPSLTAAPQPAMSQPAQPAAPAMPTPKDPTKTPLARAAAGLPQLSMRMTI